MAQSASILESSALALGMTVLVADPHKKVTRPMLKQVQFADLLARSDFVVCLAIANEQTENLMNAEAFAQMMPSAYFINLSRGNLVDEAALARALDDKRISGAALDVGRAQDQMPSLALARRADVIATPHTAGLTPEAAEHQAFDTVNQVKDLIADACRRAPQIRRQRVASAASSAREGRGLSRAHITSALSPDIGGRHRHAELRSRRLLDGKAMSASGTWRTF